MCIVTNKAGAKERHRFTSVTDIFIFVKDCAPTVSAADSETV